MSFMNWIIQRLNDAASFLYSIYLEVLSWPWPFWLAYSFFYSLYLTFNKLAWDFYDFHIWVDDVAGKVANILSYSNIYSYFRTYFDAALNAWNWVVSAWSNVTSIVNNWWLTTSATVKGWIDSAILGVRTLIDQTNSWLASLQSAWDNFKARIPSIDNILSWFGNWWGNILTSIIAWGALTGLQISSLIDSAFLSRESWWAGWQDWRDKVTEFFIDPFGWIKAHIFEPIVDDFNKGFDRGLKGE